MTNDQFMALVTEHFPDAVIDEDVTGELVISTGLRETGNGQIVKFYARSEK